jgi:S1-C subfamily serine protease
MNSFFSHVWRAVAVLIFSVESFVWAQADLTSLVKELRPSIVSIISYDEKKNVVARGTGFFTYKDGEILTRRSLVVGAHHTEVTTDDEKVYRVVRTSSEDSKADLARIVIEMPRGRVKPLVYKAKVPQVNDRVFVLGGVGREQAFVEGTVAAVEESSLGKVIRINASLTPQLNGGPVFNNQV